MSTSARLSLALVLAGILLSGCGSGSIDPESTTGTEGVAQAEVRSAASGPPAPGGSSQEGSGPSRSPSAGEGAAEPSSEEQAAGRRQKHGPSIAQPKGPREQAPTPAEIADLTVADMSLSSPSLPAGASGVAPLPAVYTCDGKSEWPALAWNGVPAGTAELILYAMNIQPVAGKLFVDWAVAGLDPGLTEIEAGKLPKGAVVGTNSFGQRGYEICPEGGEIFLFAVYALPRALSPQPGFDGRELRQQVLDVSGNVGLLSIAYTRG